MILITRPKEQSKNLKLKLSAKGYKIFQESFYSFEYYKRNVSCNKTNYYIFSSIHSVYSLKKNKQISKFKDSKIFAIGLLVSKALAEAGCKNIIFTFKDSITLLKNIKSLNVENNRFVYFSSNIVNKDFFAQANKLKMNIKKIIVYKTIPIKNFTKKLNNSFSSGDISAVTFYSKFSAEMFLKLTSKYKISQDTKRLPMYCISERVARPLVRNKYNHVYIAKRPDEKSLIACIKKEHFHVL